MSRPEDNPADDQYERDLLLAEIARLRAEAVRRDKAYDALHQEAVKETQNLLVASEIVAELRVEKRRLEDECDAERGAHLSWKAAAHDYESKVKRLREAIQEWARWDQSHTAAEGSARIALYMIAREGR